MSEYQSAFFVVPSRILELPNLVLNYLKVYETIFQFWNHGKNCYLSNSSIMERTKIKSESTIREAFMYFEAHGELTRKMVSGKRYLIQPERIVETNTQKEPVDNFDLPVAKSTPPRRQVDAPPVAKSTHNNKKINIKNINKDREAIPAEFKPNDQHISLAWSLEVDVDLEREKFYDWATANAKKMADWNAAFRNWIRKSVEFRKNSVGKNNVVQKEDVVSTMRRLSQTQGWN